MAGIPARRGILKGMRDGQETENMICYQALNQDCSSGVMPPEASADRYAWLEHEKGKWHFLTSLFADVHESKRSWSTKRRALDALIREGWTVVGSYPEDPAKPQTSRGEALGYGLLWTGLSLPNPLEKESRNRHVVSEIASGI